MCRAPKCKKARGTGATPACDEFYIFTFSLFTVLITDLMAFLMRCKDPDGAVVDLE